MALIQRFNQRQKKAALRGNPVLVDGTQSTLMDQVLVATGSNAWPKRAAAILHGLHLPVDPLLPTVLCRAGGAQWRHLDEESYLTLLETARFRPGNWAT